MASKARVRIDLKKGAYVNDVILRKFKKMCEDYKINQIYKEHEFFVRECDKRRRKKQKRKLTIESAKEGK